MLRVPWRALHGSRKRALAAPLPARCPRRGVLPSHIAPGALSSMPSCTSPRIAWRPPAFGAFVCDLTDERLVLWRVPCWKLLFCCGEKRAFSSLCFLCSFVHIDKAHKSNYDRLLHSVTEQHDARSFSDADALLHTKNSPFGTAVLLRASTALLHQPSEHWPHGLDCAAGLLRPCTVLGSGGKPTLEGL